MAERIPQSATIRVPLQAYLSSDHVSPATGKTIAITISKNGAAYGNPSGGATNATEIGSGSYYVDLSTTDTGTTGPLFVLGTASGVDNVVAIYLVVKATNGGWTALPDTACTTNASLLTSGTGTDQVSVSAGKVLLQATQTGVTIPTVTTVTNQLTAAAIATGVWQDATASDFTAASSIGKSLYTSGNAPGAASGLALVGSNMGTVTSVTGSVGSVTGAVGSVTGNVGGNVAGSVGSVSAAVTLSAGDSPVARTGTAQAGGNTTITLDSGASATTNAYTGCLVKITGGTGASAGQCRTITAYNGTTKVATVDYAWEVNPDVTSVFAVLYADSAALNSSLQVVAGSVIAGVTVTTNNDKTGYSLSQAFPTNFASLAITGGGAVTVGTNNDKTGYTLTVTPPTSAQIATAIWTDTTSSDFTTLSSPGKILQAQLGGAFTTTSSSVFTTASLANAPGGGGSVTVGGYAAGQDPATLVLGATASSWNTAGTIGAKINAAGAAADPWSTALPGSYTAGQAGYLVGTDIPAILTALGGGTITVVSPVLASNSFQIVAGCDYNSADGVGSTLQWSSSAWPVLTGSTVVMDVYDGTGGSLGTFAMSLISTGGATQTVGLTLTATQTAAMTSGKVVAVATLASGRKVPLFAGNVVVMQT